MRHVLLLVLLSVVATATGCEVASDEVHPPIAVENGPLKMPSSPGLLCSPTNSEGTATLATEVLRVSGDATANVTSVQLVEPDNLSLIEATIFPVRSRTLLGVIAHYPPLPRDVKVADAAWEQREAAVGATTEASDGDLNLALGLRVPHNGTGTARAVRVDYEVAGMEGAYVAQTQTALQFKRGRQSCRQGRK